MSFFLAALACCSANSCLGKRAFRDGDDAERLALAFAFLDGVRHGFHVVGNFRDQDHVGAASDARAQCQPAGAVAHDLDHDDAVMAVRGAVQAVDGVGGDAERGIETEGGVGQRHVVVDGFRQGHDVEACLLQAQRILHGSATAQADQAIEMIGVVVGDDGLGHVQHLAVHRHLVRLVAAGAEDGSALGEDAGQRFAFQRHGAVFHQAAKTVAKTDDVHAVMRHTGFADAAYGRVETRRVAAGGENANGLSHGYCQVTVEKCG